MNPKKEIIIISAVLGLISLALILIFVSPLLRSVKDAPLELVNIKKELALFQDKAGGMGNVRKVYEGIESDLEKVDQLFIDSESPIELIKFWRNTANALDLDISISPLSADKDKKDYWDNLTFQLNLIGSFSNFMKFLEKVESGPYLTEVQDLTIRNLTSSELSSGLFSLEALRADLTLKVFVK